MTTQTASLLGSGGNQGGKEPEDSRPILPVVGVARNKTSTEGIGKLAGNAIQVLYGDAIQNIGQ